MASYTATIQFYHSFMQYLGTVINLASDTFVMALVNSTYTFSAAHSTISDITNELSGNGYSRQTLSSVTYTQTSGTGTFDYDPVTFTASGGPIVARRFVIFDDTTSSPADALVCSGLLNASDADVTLTDGNTLTYTPAAGGQFTIAQAA